MKVKELIEKLLNLNVELEVLFEVEHGDLKTIESENIEQLKINKWGSIIFEEEANEEEIKEVVLIR